MLYIIFQNRQRRQKALSTVSIYSGEQKQRLETALSESGNLLISSDESDLEQNDDNEHDEIRLKTFSVKKLEWRSNFLDTAFQLLDRKAAERASFCGGGMPIKRMRRDDAISERQLPQNIPSWAKAWGHTNILFIFATSVYL